MDYNKLSRFLNIILIDNTITNISFADQILNAITEVFGYNKSTFWLYNPEIDSYYPAAYRVESHVIDTYLNHFYRSDPFYPDNFLNRKLTMMLYLSVIL
jgi:hypothetical protein